MSTKERQNVEDWVVKEKNQEHLKEALENASRHFDENDPFTVHTLEAIYGQESSFGKNRRSRGMDGAAGDFHLEKGTAKDYGLVVTKDNDERFDVDLAADAAARYLKDLYGYFTKGQNFPAAGRRISPVPDVNERTQFTFAAYNAGQGRIAQAQMEAEKNEDSVIIWNQVSVYLGVAGADPEKEIQITNYVPSVIEYEKLFEELSPADETKKDLSPRKLSRNEDGSCHWVTLDHGPVCIN